MGRMKKDDQNMELKILESAEKLFLEQGFLKTTTGQIAQLAGCNQALVHYYYRTKEQLFERVYEQKIQLLFSNFIAEVETCDSFEESITRMVRMHFRFLKENPMLPSFLLNECLNNPLERMSALKAKLSVLIPTVKRRLEETLNREIAAGNIRPISVLDLLFSIISLNVMPFLVMPLFQNLSDSSCEEMQTLLAHREEETVNLILARLKK
jgi:transcriptional regulator, tetR family